MPSLEVPPLAGLPRLVPLAGLLEVIDVPSSGSGQVGRIDLLNRWLTYRSDDPAEQAVLDDLAERRYDRNAPAFAEDVSAEIDRLRARERPRLSGIEAIV
jgi:hypothetical protein